MSVMKVCYNSPYQKFGSVSGIKISYIFIQWNGSHEKLAQTANWKIKLVSDAVNRSGLYSVDIYLH